MTEPYDPEPGEIGSDLLGLPGDAEPMPDEEPDEPTQVNDDEEEIDG